jgi:hypothetical protein
MASCDFMLRCSFALFFVFMDKRNEDKRIYVAREMMIKDVR